MIEGNSNPEQGEGMVWGITMADAILVNATPENSSYLTLDAEAIDVSNKYSSDFIYRTEQYCEISLVRVLYGEEEGIWEERQSLIYFPERLTFTYSLSLKINFISWMKPFQPTRYVL